METNVEEVGDGIFRLNTFVADFDLGFSQFLILDDEPMLVHTGMRALFPLVREAVASVIEPHTIRWLAFSHFEADECGALNEWLDAAPNAEPVCSLVGKMVSVDDFSSRPARPVEDGEVIETGKGRLRFVRTPHLPHCWEAGLFFEETTETLFCSDLFHQNGDVEPLTEDDVVGRARETLLGYQQSPLANYMPLTPLTRDLMAGLAGLKPSNLATMHGSVFHGDGAKALGELGVVLSDVLG